ncbi:hypothetical protein VW23_010020 [Devosia insulae DS-56]|uniref:Uncharacterized protein n=1 Tax=Devosia insulae DS-56 TaxID=1116389 RepID=A0A1E5XW26_9HYPH|nr:hypothetical protein [Devosia insulae]OEO32774.1 hypothetical protein VW23_010020 [Devosia insulae DS-56]
MALNYPGYVLPEPSQTKLTDLLDLWDHGVAQGKADRYEREAPQQFANAAAPLSQFGLTTPPDQLRALFANPNTRPFAVQMVQEATARRAVANDALLRKRIEPPQYTARQAPQSVASPTPTAAPRTTDLMATIKDDAGYDALPSGATFRAPDGSVRRKP